MGGCALALAPTARGQTAESTHPSLAQRAYLKASNTDADDELGRCVSVSGDTLVVGARSEASGATGVNGNQGDDSAKQAGAVYVFVRNGTSWSQQAYLKASNTDAGDSFGRSVAVSGDTVVIGADGEDSSATGVNGNQSDNTRPDSGAAFVFVRNGTIWSQEAYLKASNTDKFDRFGWSVSVSGDTVVVGATGEASNTTSVNGNQSNNDATGAGAAYLFARIGTTWSQRAYLKAWNTDAGDFFGTSVAMAGETVVVGADGEDSSATGVNGNPFDNGSSFAGAAYVFVRSGVTWAQEAYLKASNTDAGDFFGASVAVAGDTVVVGARWEASNATGVNGNQGDNSAMYAGAAYVFVRAGAIWSQQAYLKASNAEANDYFGDSVSISGDTAVVGALFENGNATGVNGNQGDNSAPSAGAAYVFARSGTIWSQPAYLKASNTDAGDAFGASTAVSGDLMVVGAYGEDSDATGVNGNEDDNSASYAGAAYAFSSRVPSTVYCTAGTSASGCQAQLMTTGEASATLASGFDLTAVNVEGAKDAIFFFGSNGRQAIPWGNGTSFRCVVPPVKRAGLMVGAGANGTCDGSFSKDMNAHWCPVCPKQAHNPGAGALVQAQLWYRDPFSTDNKTTSFSAAVEFSVTP